MAIKNKYDFVLLFDVENGNPNGDPDAGNAPRMDPETGYGFVTDVCLKRKIRNYVALAKEGEPGYNILVKEGKALNTRFTEAYQALELPTGKGKKTPEDIQKARDYMCQNYFDVRTFGMVMSTGDNPCGIVRGPVQLTFAQSLSPIRPQDVTITRQVDTKEDNNHTMGRKSIIPYALYRAEGSVSAMQAQKITGFSEEDAEVLWEAILNMFEEDRSAARGKMCLRKLYVFKHDHAMGKCPSHKLFDKIKVEAKTDIPRRFTDYALEIDTEMPEGVTLESKV